MKKWLTFLWVFVLACGAPTDPSQPQDNTAVVCVDGELRRCLCSGSEVGQQICLNNRWSGSCNCFNTSNNKPDAKDDPTGLPDEYDSLPESFVNNGDEILIPWSTCSSAVNDTSYDARNTLTLNICTRSYQDSATGNGLTEDGVTELIADANNYFASSGISFQDHASQVIEIDSSDTRYELSKQNNETYEELEDAETHFADKSCDIILVTTLKVTGSSGQAIGGHAVFPFSTSGSYTGRQWTVMKYNNSRKTLAHELGHVLGLVHTFDSRDQFNVATDVPDHQINRSNECDKNWTYNSTCNATCVDDQSLSYDGRNTMSYFHCKDIAPNNFTVQQTRLMRCFVENILGETRCAEGTRRCGSNSVEACQGGQWKPVEDCLCGCAQGACKSRVCTPNAKQCSDRIAQQCSSNGCFLRDVETCSSGTVCQSGVCQSTCSDACTTLGAETCSNDNVLTCMSSNSGCNQWQTTSRCSSNQVCVQSGSTATCRTQTNTMSKKACYNGDVYWYDSNNNRTSLAERCTGGESCKTVSSTNATCQCDDRASKKCYNDDVYWYDSCGNRGSRQDNCSGGEVCDQISSTNAICTCQSRASKKCYNDDVYWYDSCGNRGSRQDSCSSSESCVATSSTNAVCQTNQNNNYSVTVSYSSSWSTAGSGARDIYIGSAASSVVNNKAKFWVAKRQGTNPSRDLSYWIVVGDLYPNESDIPNYLARKTGTWSKSKQVLEVTDVNVWPSLSALQSAPCGEKKYLFAITDGGSIYSRWYYQYKAVTFTKTCP